MSRKDAVGLVEPNLGFAFNGVGFGRSFILACDLASFLRYINREPGASTAVQYWRHYYLISLSFLVTRMISFSLLARWLFRGGPEVEELLLPDEARLDTSVHG